MLALGIATSGLMFYEWRGGRERVRVRIRYQKIKLTQGKRQELGLATIDGGYR